MDPVRNPYTPGAGTRPQALVGRDAEVATFDVAAQRALTGRPTKSVVITGLRGVGKTVLLGEFGRTAEGHGYVHEHAEITEGTDFRVVVALTARALILRLSATRRATDRAGRALAVLKAFTLAIPDGPTISIDVEAARGAADSGDLAYDLGGLLRELGETAAAHGAGVLFTLDELQNLSGEQLAALVVGLHRIHQLNLPLVVAGAALPSMPGLAGQAKSYAERLFTFPEIGALPPESATEALRRPAAEEGVGWELGALARVVEVAAGFPYFLQEFGKHAWDAATESPIDLDTVEAALPAARAELDRSFFRARFDRLTDLERAYLHAMADLGPGPHRSGAIAGGLGRTSAQLGPVRDGLIRRGLLYSPRFGDTAFTVPLFDDFLRRIRA